MILIRREKSPVRVSLDKACGVEAETWHERVSGLAQNAAHPLVRATCSRANDNVATGVGSRQLWYIEAPKQRTSVASRGMSDWCSACLESIKGVPAWHPPLRPLAPTALQTGTTLTISFNASKSEGLRV